MTEQTNRERALALANGATRGFRGDRSDASTFGQQVIATALVAVVHAVIDVADAIRETKAKT